MFKKSLCFLMTVLILFISISGCSDLLAEKEIVAAGDLEYYAAIGADELKEKYKDAYIEVSGVVSYSGHSLLYLGNSLYDGLVFHCHFTSLDELENVEKGDLVTIHGDFSNCYASTVTLYSCRIVSSSNESDPQEDTNTSEDTESSIADTSAPPISKPTEAPHIHSFRPATCVAPKTCSCGATEGKANGHNWKEATCIAPKTCTICETTSGLTAGHNFSNGKCTTCGKADPDYSHETMVWIPTNGGTKYHTRPGCSNMDDPEQVTQSEAESRGFTPCKRCH